MASHNLDGFFKPTSVAVIGASEAPGAPGALVMRNLLDGDFLGPVMPIGASGEAGVFGQETYRDVDALPLTPDLSVVCVERERMPDVVAKLARRGAKAAILASSRGYAGMSEEERRSWREELLKISRPAGLRLMGPGSMGVVMPGLGLTAGWAHTTPKVGRIAFVSQSNALVSTVLDWAKSRDIGFSSLIALGERVDVGFSDVLDYLSIEPRTRSILLYLESICDARGFLSAARALSRNKPILVVKPRHVGEFQWVETGCDVSAFDNDDVYDAAFRRAGMLRVMGVDQLFDAVETLARMQPIRGDRLAILSNGAGPGLLAADALVEGGGRLAKLTGECEETLCRIFATPSRGHNPIAVDYDAPAEAYGQALELLLQEKETDAALILRAPTLGSAAKAQNGESQAVSAARAVIAASRKYRKPVLVNWLGAGEAAEARKLFAEAGAPSYETPDKAIRAFLHMADFRKSQELLMQTPASLPTDFQPDLARARAVLEEVRAEGRLVLSEPESMEVLAAYSIPTATVRFCETPELVPLVASEMGLPVAVKIVSDEIASKSEVGGVALDLENEDEALTAARTLKARLRKVRPQACLKGFSVQRMERRPGAVELFVRAWVDPIFGPVIRFGHGGSAWEVVSDQAAALPPLNLSLARELISRTRISKVLKGYLNLPPADIDALCRTLIQVAQLIVDEPTIGEIDVNPLLADAEGVMVLDARVRLAPLPEGGALDVGKNLAIRPYPRELEEKVVLKNGLEAIIRPIRPEDEPAHFAFFRKLTPEDIRLRFFGALKELSHQEMARLTQIDYDREMAFVIQAPLPDEGPDPQTLGVVRANSKPTENTAEFAVMVRSDLKGMGIGVVLLDKLIRYLRAAGVKTLTAQTLPDNTGMQALARKLGFDIHKDFEEEMVEMSLEL